ETSAPDTDEPETPAPDTDEPETSAPDTDEPETPAPDTDEPETSAPDTDEPETPAPDTDEPETPEPDTDEPETPAPDTDEPETSAPDTDEPADETDKPVDPADKDRLKADLVAALRELLTGCTVDPASVIPETMLVDYRQNLVDPSELPDGYVSSVSVSDIPVAGSGEQWHMVLDNLEQSALFFDLLAVVDTLTTVSVQTFETFFDKNPEETAIHTFEESIYSVTIHYDDDTVAYVLDYTANIPALGEQKVQIALSLDRQTREKAARIQLGNGNALAYTYTEASYTFALELVGVRHAFFTVNQDEDGNVYGHINEFLTVKDVQVQSAADFYITEDYVTVVGNKADGMLLFDGRICELYRVADGRLVGYEVKETESLLGIEFDTLWFDLSAFTGFTSIRYAEATDETDAAFYVNNSKNPWESEKVGLFNPSRRFDIEFRTRYYNVYDPENDEYKVERVQVPMLFVQEGYLESLTKDIKSANGIQVNLGVDGDELEKLMADYDAFIPEFDEHKAAITTDLIEQFIGEPTSFQ
ncbi:MAG: hypothetical protein J6B24_04905, partial [Clostridia bacterium]|nr:hypothetical protein [Clostridia bacterium]